MDQKISRLLFPRASKAVLWINSWWLSTTTHTLNNPHTFVSQRPTQAQNKNTVSCLHPYRPVLKELDYSWTHGTQTSVIRILKNMEATVHQLPQGHSTSVRTHALQLTQYAKSCKLIGICEEPNWRVRRNGQEGQRHMLRLLTLQLRVIN